MPRIASLTALVTLALALLIAGCAGGGTTPSEPSPSPTPTPAQNEGTGTDAWPFDQPEFIILNVAIGGSWGGLEGIDDSLFPHVMQVDYVRVYQRQ